MLTGAFIPSKKGSSFVAAADLPPNHSVTARIPGSAFKRPRQPFGSPRRTEPVSQDRALSVTRGFGPCLEGGAFPSHWPDATESARRLRMTNLMKHTSLVRILPGRLIRPALHRKRLMMHHTRGVWMVLNSLSWFACLPAFGTSPSPIPAATTRVATPTPSPPAQPRALKPEDFAALRDVDEPNISPDGNLM
jgi:hypothetical protein